MPSINLEKDLYDRLVRINQDPVKVANQATREAVEKLEKEAKHNGS